MSEGERERDDMWAVVNRYIRTDTRLETIRREIGRLHEEADGLLVGFDADAKLIKVAMTANKSPVLRFNDSQYLLLQGSTLRVVKPANAITLKLPEITPGLPSHDEALEDAKLALDNAIEDCNDAAEAAAYCKVRAVPAEVVTA